MLVLPSKAIPEQTKIPLPTERGFDPMFVPRSIGDGLTYVPWWRSMLANYYDQQRLVALAKNEPYSLPRGETDALVIHAYSRLAFGACETKEATSDILWCSDAHHRAKGSGAKIRAMVVAGLTNEEIARCFGTTPHRIDIYLKLFFEIRECLPLSHWMDTFLRLEADNIISSTSDTNEIMWLVVGYHLGREILDHVIAGRLPFLSAEALAPICGKTCDMFSGLAFLHMVSNTIKEPNGRAVDLERYIQILDISARNTGGGGNGRQVGGGGGGGNTDVVEWMLEAANERHIFDPGIWNEVRGASGSPGRIVDVGGELIEAPQPARMMLGAVQRKRLFDSLIPETKPPCKRSPRSVSLPL